MRTAYLFPGQGAQFTGMGKDLYDEHTLAKELFKKANQVLGVDIAQIMFEGTDEELKQTSITQPAIYIHSVVAAKCLNNFNPRCVAGHSLGEFSALAAANVFAFDAGLKLVQVRANAMQEACNNEPSGMAAVLGLEDDVVKTVCDEITNEIVVAANFNTVGQVVISGSEKGVELAMEKLTEAGARRVIKLNVNGAFHSPLMASAKNELEQKINNTDFSKPICPVYQNVVALPVTETEQIKQHLITQLTAPVLFTQTVKNMLDDGVEAFEELGPGKVLSGLVKKVQRAYKK